MHKRVKKIKEEIEKEELMSKDKFSILEVNE